eukprot:5038920-Amphidinium_carterae.1
MRFDSLRMRCSRMRTSCGQRRGASSACSRSRCSQGAALWWQQGATTRQSEPPKIGTAATAPKKPPAERKVTLDKK